MYIMDRGIIYINQQQIQQQMFLHPDLKAPTKYSIVRNDELLALLKEYVVYLEGMHNSPVMRMLSSNDSMLKLADKILTLNKRIDNLTARLTRDNNTDSC